MRDIWSQQGYRVYIFSVLEVLMKSYRIWLFKLFGITVLLISLLSICLILIDPYKLWHKAEKLDLVPNFNERIQNPGLALNYGYLFDSILVGDSLTQNSSPEIYKNVLDKKLLKLSITGASSYENKLMIEYVLLHNKQVKDVYWGIHFPSFARNEKFYAYRDTPFYLYDKSRLNDFRILLSSSILVDSFKVLFKINSSIEYEKLYDWMDLHKERYGKDKVLARWGDENYRKIEEEFSLVNVSEHIKNNFESVIEAHPDVKFHVFHPPLSYIALKQYEVNDYRDLYFTYKNIIADLAEKHKNVELFDFQANEEVVKNLDNYMDFEHYNRDINNLFPVWIKNKMFVVNKETRQNIQIIVRSLFDLPLN